MTGEFRSGCWGVWMSIRDHRRLGRVSRKVVGGHDVRLSPYPWHARGMPPQADSAANETQLAPKRNHNADQDVWFRERLGAPAWAWFVVFGLVLCLTVAFWVPLGAPAGLVCLVLGSALVTWLLLTTATTTVVTARELRAGRAHLSGDAIGLVATLDAAATANARGANADPRAFTIMRSLSAKESVSLEILDDDDPHPYWLISTRRPLELGRAIRQLSDGS